MGGVFPEQPDPSHFQQVLDMGCGTGGWLIEVAKQYPSITGLIGVDISQKAINFAQRQANEQQVEQQTTFQVMDTLGRLHFPNQTFDMINQRLGMSFLRTWDWTNLLNEYRRIARHGAVIRITEGGVIQTNSQALTQLNSIFVKAMAHSGRISTPEIDKAIDMLPLILEKNGIQQVRTHTYEIIYRAGTPTGDLFIKDTTYLFRTLFPFFRKWTRIPDNYEELYQQMLIDMTQPDFECRWTLQTVWGNRE